MAGGRPTKLTKAVIEQAKEYDLNWRQIDGSPVPTKEGLALHLDVERPTLYEWAKLETPLGQEFSYIFNRVMAKQGRTLVAHGLDGSFNPTIAKMMLSRHEYVEKTEVDNNLKGDVTFVNSVPRPQGGDGSGQST